MQSAPSGLTGSAAIAGELANNTANAKQIDTILLKVVLRNVFIRVILLKFLFSPALSVDRLELKLEKTLMKTVHSNTIKKNQSKLKKSISH